MATFLDIIKLRMTKAASCKYSLMSNVVQKLNNSAQRDGSYLPTLDGWRAFAILLVLFAHGSESINNVLNVIGINFELDRLKMAGLLGVQIFFGLSGFLITSRLIASEKKYGRISLKSFYIRRSFRILPPALVFLIAAGTLALLGIIPITFGRWISSLFFFANYSSAAGIWYLGHFWSLAVEEHFYMIWPTLFLVLGIASRRVQVAIAIALLLAVWRVIDLHFNISGATPAMFWGRTDIQGDNILWGAVIALLYADPVWKERLEKFLSLPAILPSFVVFIIALAVLPSPAQKVLYILLTIKPIVIALMILGTVTNCSKMLSYVLERPFFTLIGRLSYSIYLWQQLFMVWNEASISSFGILQSLPFNILATFTCATLSYLYIERPMIAAGHRIASKII
jgi:peptidoglycan/LPS O-acetylase OafA/YrhL